jgi:hypothetical protein
LQLVGKTQAALPAPPPLGQQQVRPAQVSDEGSGVCVSQVPALQMKLQGRAPPPPPGPLPELQQVVPQVVPSA